MRKTITQIHSSSPIVNRNNGLMTDQFRLHMLGVQLNGLWIGDGDPDGVIEAEQGQMLLDETAVSGVDPILYIKQKADIGGDKTLGWAAI